MPDFHHIPTAKVITQLKTSQTEGLTDKEVAKRRSQDGYNRLPQAKRLGKAMLFLQQFTSPLMYILLIAGGVTVALHEYTDAIVIFAAVLLNAIVGFIQESKANESLAALREMVKNTTVVIRDGTEHEVDQEELVQGDIVKLRAGDKVPADGRILEAHELKINESALTGEWQPVEKNNESLEEETFFADRTNMAYMGTVVESGAGLMVVTATAKHSEFGRVADMIKETEETATPYQERLAKFSKILGFVIVVVSVLIFVEGMLTGGEFEEMFVTAVAVAVAAVPEGMPMAITVILAIGMQRILKRKGLVRRLASAETLGSTSIICTDKTGTLTEGKMEVVDIIAFGEEYDNRLPKKDTANPAHERIYHTITLLTEAFIENPEDKVNDWQLRGRPTDRALLMAGYKAGFTKEQLAKDHEELDRIPFTSDAKFSAAVFQTGKATRELLVMGAPEVMFERCAQVRLGRKLGALTDKRREALQETLQTMTSEGLRVLAVAHAKQPGPKGSKQVDLVEEDVNELIFLGFVALKDPLRKQAKKTIRIARRAGLHPVIITGDHQLTATAIARELGLKIKENAVITGTELEKISDKELAKRVNDIVLYARVRPEQKLRIVNAWQSLGKVVAMTGDGINDAPALKKADVGVALGSGTVVAKESADLVLLDNNFGVIVAAVEEGRGIIDNIRKVITYLLSSSFTEIIVIGGALFLGMPLPLLATHILWVNFIQDSFPALALAFEPKENDLMKRKPLPKDMPLLNGEMRLIIAIVGLFTSLMLFGTYWWYLNYTSYELLHVRSVIFAGLAIDSMLYIFSCKSLRKPLWRINPFSNVPLLIATGVSTVALVGALYLPVLQTLLQTTGLNAFDWAVVLGLGVASIVLIEASKWVFIRSRKTS